MLTLKNVRPLMGGKIAENSDIVIKEGKISAILPSGSAKEGEIIDMGGAVCASGFIDIHTHGGYGHDMMEGTYEAIDKISEYHLTTGTTSYCPTTLTADIPTTLAALDNVRNYNSKNTARRIGVHLEGPYLSMKAPGAHPTSYILNPNEENTAWVFDNKDVVSRITTAPDNAGAAWLTERCVAQGIQVSIGHDASIDDEIYATIDKGASTVTHMYNCTSRPSRRTTPHKHLGLTEVGLISDKLVCEVIADNRHVPNPLFGMIFKLKGAEGIAFVSDSLSVAGMGAGEYYLGSGDSRQKLLVDEGVATLPELNTYAGSVTPISQMVINCYKNVGVSLEDCLTMGTLTPAKVMNLTDRGDIAIGMLADINIFDNDANIIHTVFDGKLIK